MIPIDPDWPIGGATAIITPRTFVIDSSALYHWNLWQTKQKKLISLILFSTGKIFAAI